MISKRNGDVVRDNRMLTMTLDCRRFVTRGTCICATDRKRYIQFAVFGTETFQSTVKYAASCVKDGTDNGLAYSIPRWPDQHRICIPNCKAETRGLEQLL